MSLFSMYLRFRRLSDHFKPLCQFFCPMSDFQGVFKGLFVNIVNTILTYYNSRGESPKNKGIMKSNH